MYKNLATRNPQPATRNPQLATRLLTFPALHRLLDGLLHVERFAATDDQNGVFLPPARPDAPVGRLGLVLEPGPDLLPWIEHERLDALFLHRPWSLNDERRRALAAGGVGVLAYHLAFDEDLTTGLNPALAAACGWGEPTVLGEKEGRPLGMWCALAGPTVFGAVAARLEAEFGGLEEVTPPAAGSDSPVTGAACVGVMNDRLVRAAHAAGAGVYVTGQWRQPARAAVRETGIGVVAVGHARSERWGLRALARRLREHPTADGLEVCVLNP